MRAESMRPALQLRTTQHLTLTPQLRQSIRLLAMSATELSQEIQQAIESNPFVEDVELTEEVAVPEFLADGSPPESQATATAEEEGGTESDFDMERDLPESGGAAPDDDSEPEVASGLGLHEHLHFQLRLSALSEQEMAIGEALIDGIDEHGYLREPPESIQQALRPEVTADLAQIEAVRQVLMRFDPSGVGARDLRESLCVQLEEHAGPVSARARAIVEGHLEALGRGDFGRIAQALGCETADVVQAQRLIRRLRPHPGDGFDSGRDEVVIPEVYVRKLRDRYEVRLNGRCSRQLRLNGTYRGLLGQVSGEDLTYLRGQLQDARWLLRCLKQREQSVLKVAQAIVAAQRDFLDHGPERLKPMVMRDIAEQVGLHESTISRVVARKYMDTPRGVFELRYFFTSHVATRDGGEASARAIQAMIRKMIGTEAPNKPLSDQALADLLKRQGILVARRTVAKYREAMNIPTSSDRQRVR